MNITQFQTTEDFVTEAIKVIADLCAGKDVVRIALSGGSTPQPIFEALAENTEIPFENIEFYQVDERYVPGDHPDSNRSMMERTMINALSDRIKGFYYFDTALPLEACVSGYENLLQEKLGGDGFDLVLLGIGTDGHTASLFPHSDVLFEEKSLTAHSTTDEFAIRDRVTITFPLIMTSSQLLVLLKGSDKSDIIDKIKDNQHFELSEFPAKKLCEHDSLAIFHRQ